jgi:hypothetical protein
MLIFQQKSTIRNHVFIFQMLCRDDGDCVKRFSSAGQDASSPCDRSVCSTFLSDYDSNSFRCASSCFNSSCDWSRAVCAPQKAVISNCPLFDATVLVSVRNQQKQKQMLFVFGGTSGYVDTPVTFFHQCTN